MIEVAMTPAPKRRWFQFTLRTLFVVMAIVGWGLGTRPYLLTEREWWGLPPGISDAEAIAMFNAGELNETNVFVAYVEHHKLNPQLLWPTLALCGLLAWNASRAFFNSGPEASGI
jgi:hypothetical protein